MTVRDHLGRSLAVSGALAVLGLGALTMTERALAIAPDAPAGVADKSISKPSTGPAQTVGPDNTNGVKQFTINVQPSEVQGVVRDVDVVTRLLHDYPGDVEIELEHGGKKVTLVRGPKAFPSANFSDFFANAVFDDSGEALGSKLSGLDVGKRIVPEGALGAFVGMPASGDWILRVWDRSPAPDPADPESLPDDADGQFQGWELRLATQSAFTTPPAVVPTAAGPAGSPEDIGDGTDAPSTSTINVSTPKSYVWDVDLTTNIQHEAPDDLDVRLSHAGRTVVISSRNPRLGPFLMGRRFDDSATSMVTRPSGSEELIPEGALAAFIGTNPNGPWTLEVRDQLAPDAGKLIGWSLDIDATDAVQPPVTPPITPPVTPPVVAPPVTPAGPGVTPPVVRPQALKLGVRKFAVGKNRAKRTVRVNVGWFRGTGRVNYTATLSAKIGKKTVRRTIKGAGQAGVRNVSRTVKVPKNWKNKKVTVRLVVKNGSTTVVRTKTIRRF